jgi:glycosyltransferase involved in cell wall biosynthesis
VENLTVANASISIVIAASTAPQAVAECVRAVIAQTLRPAEIIVVGADSVFDTDSLCRFGDMTTVPLRVFTQTHGVSLADDLNTAWPVVRGEFLTFIEAHETPPPDFLARLAAPLTDAGWTCSGAVPGPVTLNAIVEAGPVTGAVLVPRELADRCGPFDAATAGCERWETALQAALNAPGFCLTMALPSAQTATRPQPGAIAQVLRRQSAGLRAALPDPDAAAARALGAVSADDAQIRRALGSLTLPYLDRGTAPGSNLAFLISPPRAGSTLLQRILGAHPDIVTLPEPWIMLNACHALHPGGVEADYEPALAARALGGFLDEVGGGAEAYYDAVRAMSDRLYAAALQGSGARVFLDKTPRYFHILPELRAIYPAARFIFLLRHPLAVAASALDTWFDGDVEAFRQNKNAVDCVTGPRRIMEAVHALGDAAVCLRYEDLSAQPEVEIRRLCERLGLGFDPSMLDYAGIPLVASEFGDQENIARHTHPVADYAERWRTRYDEPERATLGRELLDELGADLVTAMGYDFDAATALLAAAGQAAGSADALTGKGEACFAAGDLDAAERLFLDAVNVDPGFSLAHNNLGVLYAARGDHERAIECFIAALTIHPAERDAIVNLIECAAAANRLTDCLPGLAAYLQAVPDDEEVMAMARQLTAVLDNTEHVVTPDAAPVAPLPRGPEILLPGEVPRISIVTASFNQGDYLEACIDSILSQNYPNLDYIIMDGGSTDQSVSIIRRYEKYLSHWQSGADDGQYAAIEAGFKRSDGDIMAWLNSDDKYHADALWKVSYAFMTRPQVDWVTGLYTFWDDRGTLTGVLDPVYWTQARQLDPGDLRTIQQESTFWRRSLWDKAGARLATELYYAGDWDLWTRFFRHAELHTLEWTLGGYRYHEGQKVGTDASGYTVEANELLAAEQARLRAAGTAIRDDIPGPIRYTDEELLELRAWRDTNRPASVYVSKYAQKKKSRATKSGARSKTPTISVVTSLPDDGSGNDAGVDSWLAAGWRVVSVNNVASAAAVQACYPNVEVVQTTDVSTLREAAETVTFRAILAQARQCETERVGVIQPGVVIDRPAMLAHSLATLKRQTVCYGDKFAVNSTAVLDGIADGYGYFFASPGDLARFNPGPLTFGHEWWIHWILMTAIADKFSVHKIAEPHAFRIRQQFSTPYDEQVHSSKACIASVLAKYLPPEFRQIPSLKLSFDIESGDFEKFARSFVGSRAA